MTKALSTTVQPFHVMDILARCKQMEAQGIDVVHMEIGEPDFPTPEPIIQAGMQALQAGATQYTSAQGLPELRQALSNYYLNRFSAEVDADEIIITPGASGALQLLFAALLQDKKKLMLCDPSYPCYANLSRIHGAERIAVAVDESSQFQITLELVERNWQTGIAAVMVANPSNPTGTLCDVDELKRIAEFLEQRDAYLIVDEIYQGLVYTGESKSLAAAADNVFVLNSFSKFFGMTGWRLGWLTAAKKHIPALDAIAQNSYLASSTISQHAAIAAFNADTQLILEQRRQQFQTRRDFVCQALADIGLTLSCMPQGAFYLYVNIAKLNIDSFDFCQQLLQEQALAITPGCDFGQYRANEFVRLAYTTSEDRLAEGMRRLAEFIA
tara:strand:- start:445 stop:1596 length:1152 start_codon:yes stop_codon:yes gene_type:complete